MGPLYLQNKRLYGVFLPAICAEWGKSEFGGAVIGTFLPAINAPVAFVRSYCRYTGTIKEWDQSGERLPLQY